MNVCILSWNVGGIKSETIPEVGLKKAIYGGDVLLKKNHEAPDMFILNFQEFRDLNKPVNYLPNHLGNFMASHSRSRRASSILTTSWNREKALCAVLDQILSDYSLLCHASLVGLATYVYVSKNYMKMRRIERASIGSLSMGMAHNAIANKGAIFFKLRIDSKELCFCNVHLCAGKGKKKLDRRMEQLKYLLEHLGKADSEKDVIVAVEDFEVLKVPEKESPDKKARSPRQKARSPRHSTKTVPWRDKYELMVLSGDFNFRGLITDKDERMPQMIPGLDSPLAKSHDELPPLAKTQSRKKLSKITKLGSDKKLAEPVDIDPAELWRTDEFRNLAKLVPRPQNPIREFVEAHELTPPPKRSLFSTLSSKISQEVICTLKLSQESVIQQKAIRPRGSERPQPPFPMPTYKYDGAKLIANRIPAWTDRILVGYGARGNRMAFHCISYQSIAEIDDSDHKPILGSFKLIVD